MAVNTTGNPILASAGSGDVLAGAIGAFACSQRPYEAAMLGVHVHGLVGDVLRARSGERGTFSGELADAMPQVLDAMTRDETLPGFAD